MKLTDYTDANRKAWDQAASFHTTEFQRHLENFKQPGHTCLDATAVDLLNRAGIMGKDVVQLCCNNGREILSIRNSGAARCTGFDISKAFIDQGKLLAQAAGSEIELHAMDIFDIPENFHNCFDLVYISVGAIGWLPELERFYALVRALLRPGGQLLIYEMHPILDMFEPKKSEEPVLPMDSYFRQKPFVSDEGLDYYENQSYESQVNYWFHHKMSDIIQGCINADFNLDYFQEFEHDLSNEYASFANHKANYPLSYALIASL